jgi:hypothetical protein
MLRNMQQKLLDQLERFERGLKKRDEFDDADRDYLERLAHRQGIVKDIWNRMLRALGGGR